MVLLTYHGEGAAPTPFSGSVTGTVYAFGGKKKEQFVDVQDAAIFLTQYKCATCSASNGMLFTAPAPEPAVAEVVAETPPAAQPAAMSAPTATTVAPAAAPTITTTEAASADAPKTATMTEGARQLLIKEGFTPETINITGTGAGGNITIKDARAFIKANK